MTPELPPLLIKGKGCPVTGNQFTATAMLTKACIDIISAEPSTRSIGTDFVQRLAIFKALNNKNKYRKGTPNKPNQPKSSMIMAKIKSE